MNHDDYISFASEIEGLEALLARIPKENVISRMGLQSRLKAAQEAIAGYNPLQLPRKARLTFRGRPVFGSHGASAELDRKSVV